MSELLLGTMTFGLDWGWGASPELSRQIFDAYVEAGGNVVDTANSYTDGSSEKIVGELIRAERDRYVLSTKYTSTLDPGDPNAGGNARKSLTRSVEQSLRRMKTDRIDLLWVHIWDPLTPVAETMRALDDMVSAGKVLYVGISDAPAWVVAQGNTLADWHGWSPFIGIQVAYSLVRRDIERELLPMAASFGLSVAAWAPLGAGVLTGKFTRTSPPSGTRVKPDAISDRQLHVARVTDDVADELGTSSARVALAWTMRRRFVHPIIGVRDMAQMTDVLGACDLRIPDEAMARLDQASAIEIGFPNDTLTTSRQVVYGEAGWKTDPQPYIDLQFGVPAPARCPGRAR